MDEKEIMKLNKNVKNFKVDNRDEELLMYILVNQDLKMTAGKIAGQCCHSVRRITTILENMKLNNYYIWCKNYEPKIVLKASTEQLTNFIDNYSNMKKPIWCIATYDLGRTQIEEGSLTTICFNPMKRKDVPMELQELRLMH